MSVKMRDYPRVLKGSQKFMNSVRVLRPAVAGILLLFLLVGTSQASSTATVIHSNSGITASLNRESGSYRLEIRKLGWSFGGTLGRAAEGVHTGRGMDRIGEYVEIGFNADGTDPFSGVIKVYEARPVVLFSITNLHESDSIAVDFPRFTVFPKGLHHFSYKDRVFAPYTFSLDHASTPWLLFDNSLHAVIVSPANYFFVSTMKGNGIDQIASGLRRQLPRVPAHFTHRTIVAFGHGINLTWDTWGKVLTALSGKSRPSNGADPVLRYLGYWTDNGATYYYNYDTTLGYEGTLEKVIEGFHGEGIPIRYLQLDSWWYRKSFTGPEGKKGKAMNPALPAGEWNRFGGTMIYKADSSLFPEGLASFQREVGMPLVTHGRWIDPASPYHEEYNIAGYAVVDPRWWKATMCYLSSADIICYEQDWLSVISRHSEFGSKLNVGSEFADHMAGAATNAGLDMQYCMAFPSFFLQGSKYGNLTSIGVSNDRFDRSKWDSFLYASKLASSVGIWPWTDVFMSAEGNNLLLSTLSAGPVGIGDRIGKEDPKNISEAVRSDGVIVKPDAPIVPEDQMYVARAEGKQTPMVAWTYTDHGPIRTAYVFAYSNNEDTGSVSVTPSSFGLKGEVVVYDTRTGAAVAANANSNVNLMLGKEGTEYFVITPVEKSGIAFFGDKHEFVSDGRNRIASLKECGRELSSVVSFAAGEISVRLFGYSVHRPRLQSTSGKISGNVYDDSTHLFEFTLSPAGKARQVISMGERLRQARVRMTGQ